MDIVHESLDGYQIVHFSRSGILRERRIALAELLNMPRNISSTIYDGEFTCYDPGTQYASQGNGVLYSNSWAASHYGGIDQVTFLYYFS